MVSVLDVLAFTATLVILCNAQKEEYCNIKSCGTRPHTSCEYSALQESENCGKVERSGLSPDEIQVILDVHNRLRNRVASGNEMRGNPGPQPAAKNLGPLKWSSEFAEIAQTWANQCTFDHDLCRDIEEYSVGQNIFFGKSTRTYKPNMNRSVNSWYDEVDEVDKNTVESPNLDLDIRHYTQLVWAETTHLGCGAVLYNPDGVWNKFLLVCNYGPAGNWIGKPIYELR